MKSIEILRENIEALNGRDYGGYQVLKGTYDYPEFKLTVEQIPHDPYAPSHTGLYRILIDNSFGVEADMIFGSKTSKTAFCDFLARKFYDESLAESKGRRGTGYSGIITLERPGQTILERNSVIADMETIEVRFFMGLPADGRDIDADTCKSMFFDELPKIVEKSLLSESIDKDELKKHIEVSENAEHIRSLLGDMGLVAFIGDGSVLPRKSGTSDAPLTEGVVPFMSPQSMGVEISLPNGIKVRGMGIPKGVTLIVGGGYHGKTTLLNAVEMGIYNHIPGDGREMCITDMSAVKVRAYSGRYVEKVDISMFIDNLPFQKDTVRFSTENASGSTSQAASIMEAIEAGAGALMMDEDTCATNFMIRDSKMQKLVQKDDEPITTFIDRARSIYSKLGISTIIVLGGIGDYFEISDIVIQMKNYLPMDVTKAAHVICGASREKRVSEGKEAGEVRIGRVVEAECISPYNAYNKRSIYATDVSRINFGSNVIDLTDVEQVIELSQTKSIAEAILYMSKYADGNTTLREIIEKVILDIEEKGLDAISERTVGNFSRFRAIDLAFAVNRLRGLKIV